MPDIQNQEQQEVFDIIYSVWLRDRSVDDAYEDLQDYLDPAVLNAPDER